MAEEDKNKIETESQSPLKDLDTIKQEFYIDDHKLTIEELTARYETDIQKGLTKAKARERYQQDGPNELTPPKKEAWWISLLSNMFKGFSILLWIGAVLYYIAYIIQVITESAESLEEFWLATTLIFVCIITGTLSYVQKAKSERIIESFQKMIPYYARVIRDGKQTTIVSTRLVKGDLIELKFGDRVPADIRIIESNGFMVDNSSLTGESEAQLLNGNVSNANFYMDAENLAFFSTYVVEGTAKGIVILCGNNTVIGHIANVTSKLKEEDTPIAKEIQRFMHFITVWAISIGILFFILTLFFGYKWLEAVIYFIGITVASVPEGLLATVTVSLSLTAKRMASKNCLVKHLEAVETLGSVSAICTDKTGTLTQNVMTVTHISINRGIIKIDYSKRGIPKDIQNTKVFQGLIRAACLCSKAEFLPGQKKVHPLRRKVTGDASEAAIIKFSEWAVGNVAAFREKYKKVAEIPFNSTDKFQASIHVLPSNEHLLVMKGAPEKILERCIKMRYGEYIIDINEKLLKETKEIIEKLGNNGERVIAFCELFLNSTKYPIGFQFNIEQPNFPLTKLNFLGIMSMMDPPKPGVAEAVSKCRTAGIRVIMITGDHPLTAKSIAKMVGIISKGSETLEDIAKRKKVPVNKVDPREATALLLEGPDLRRISPKKLEYLLYTNKEIIFARTSPVQKLQIVEAFQRLGAIVAVTGDGVNDSPALKKADIGISMGRTGSDVSKQAADMILLDDNFASIVTGVEEGRLIFDNLKKSITYSLASNTPEIVPFLISIFIGIPLPLSVVGILFIDLGTNMWPSISLAYEKAESDIMQRVPRNPKKDKLVTSKLLLLAYSQFGIIEVAAGFFSYFTIMAQNGWLPNHLIGVRNEWYMNAMNDLEDSYGQEWTYSKRQILNYNCQTVFFISIVVVQLAVLIACKTRYNSIVDQGMDNWILNFGLLFELILVCFLLYFPGMDKILKMYPLKLQWWLLAIPFAIFLFIYDECRRFWLRKYPGGWIRQYTYY
ncbi:hypothetical protein PGB90_003436 [Kerria lacca]